MDASRAPADPVNRLRGSLITPLGLVEGDILTFLEEHGATTLRRLIRGLEWPARMVMMGVGALVRERLVQAMQLDVEVVLTLRVGSIGGERDGESHEAGAGAAAA